MIFGLDHLDTAPASFQVAWLEPVLYHLRGYKPDLILTEAMSGEQVMGLEAYAAYHGDAGKYAGPTLQMAKTAQADLLLTAAQALVQANELSQKGDLAPAQRRRLAGLFVAAVEPLSAAVQWLRLPAAERIGADGISPALAKQVTLLANLHNEMSSGWSGCTGPGTISATWPSRILRLLRPRSPRSPAKWIYLITIRPRFRPCRKRR